MRSACSGSGTSRTASTAEVRRRESGARRAAPTQQSGAEWMADTFIAAPDLVSLLERAISAQYRFAVLHAAAPGPNVLLDTRATEDLLGWSAEHSFRPAFDR